MSAADRDAPVADAEAERLFRHLDDRTAVLLAVSGGPDSTALLLLAARWRARKPTAPRLFAATVDHGLRPESAAEAAAVAAVAAALGIPHRTLLWSGAKPRTGLPEAARAARYALLSAEAARVGAADLLTAHTRDDQAETVLLRLAAGSGVGGLGAIAPVSSLRSGLRLLRPLLDVPKARLVATCRAADVAFADDATNADTRFARARLRQARDVLAREGLTAARLVRLAARARRAEAALAWAAEQAASKVVQTEGDARIPLAIYGTWPDEVAFRVLRGAVAAFADGAEVPRGKLERILAAMPAARSRSEGEGARRRPWSRTLAGALLAIEEDAVVVRRAPARRSAERLARAVLVQRKGGARSVTGAEAFTSSDEEAGCSLGIRGPGTYIAPGNDPAPPPALRHGAPVSGTKRSARALH